MPFPFFKQRGVFNHIFKCSGHSASVPCSTRVVRNKNSSKAFIFAVSIEALCKRLYVVYFHFQLLYSVFSQVKIIMQLRFSSGNKNCILLD